MHKRLRAFTFSTLIHINSNELQWNYLSKHRGAIQICVSLSGTLTKVQVKVTTP